MKRFLSIILILNFYIGHSQDDEQFLFDQLSSQISSYHKENFRELVFVTTNTRFLVSGETLYFSIHCLNKATYLPSGLSQLVYVVLLDEGKQVVMKSKISLNNGRGYGDFFIPSSLSSGNYYLVAYTSLIRNQELKDIFQMELRVVNPFTPVQILDGPNPREDVDVKLFVEGNSYVKNLENALICTISGDFKYPGTMRITKDNEVINTFRVEDPVSRISLTPTDGNYRLILTDSTRKNYFPDLPESEAGGFVLNIEDSNGYFAISLRSSSKDPVFLIGVNKGLMIHFEKVEIDGEKVLVLPKEKVPAGISNFILVDSKARKIASRLIFNPPIEEKYSLISDKQSYGTREKVRLQVRSLLESNFSVTVQKDDNTVKRKHPLFSKTYFRWNELDAEWNHIEFENLHHYLATYGMREFPWKSGISTNLKYEYTPDFHGNFITGILKSSSTSNPIADTEIHMSLPGINFQFLSAKTNESGEFYFNISSTFEDKDLYIQAFTPEEYDLELVDGFLENYDFIETTSFDLDTSLLKLIEKKSLYSQIENAYYDVKKTIYSSGVNPLFYGQPDKVYILDEYTRFPTMEDVFREITTSIMIRKRKDSYSLRILDTEGELERFDPMVLMDGVPIKNINDLVEYDAMEVDRVEVIRKKYYYGPVVFYGIISIRTKEGNLRKFPIEDRLRKISYTSMQPTRTYYKPDYEKDPAKRIPDYRELLYWDHDLSIERNRPAIIEFFTSDIPGSYRVWMEGFNEAGDPVLLTHAFEVKSN